MAFSAIPSLSRAVHSSKNPANFRWTLAVTGRTKRCCKQRISTRSILLAHIAHNIQHSSADYHHRSEPYRSHCGASCSFRPHYIHYVGLGAAQFSLCLTIIRRWNAAVAVLSVSAHTCSRRPSSLINLVSFRCPFHRRIQCARLIRHLRAIPSVRTLV